MALQHVPDTYSPERKAAFDFLDALFSREAAGEFCVRLWDGSVWQPSTHAGDPQKPRFILVLKHPGALRRMFSSPSDRALGEAYIYDDFDVEGDIEAIFAVGDRLFERGLRVIDRLKYASLLRRLSRSQGPYETSGPRLSGAPHSEDRDRQAVTYHYNVSNDFYRLWLDSRMVYSCAYFLRGDEELDTAQEQKLDYLCRKLRIHPGETLLDIGCGWGGLIMHAAKRFGARALGITLSEPQAEFANRRIREAGLHDCRADVRDYRELEDPAEPFDKIVSVGMFEHVGQSKFQEYFERISKLLRPGGMFLNHSIAESAHKPHRGASFVAKYVFPDGELVPLHTTLRAAEEAGWEVRDVESLREHYALTLHHWLGRLEGQAGRARDIVGDVAYRIWRLYMAGATHRFRTGWLNVYQVLLAKPDRGQSGLPWTRTDWYV